MASVRQEVVWKMALVAGSSTVVVTNGSPVVATSLSLSQIAHGCRAYGLERPHCTMWRSVRRSCLSRLWRPDAGRREKGRLGQLNAATWTKGTESPWSTVGLFIHSLLRRSSTTVFRWSVILPFSMIVRSEINLQKIARSMYNTHPWLSRLFYGNKSAYYIRSFSVTVVSRHLNAPLSVTLCSLDYCRKLVQTNKNWTLHKSVVVHSIETDNRSRYLLTEVNTVNTRTVLQQILWVLTSVNVVDEDRAFND